MTPHICVITSVHQIFDGRIFHRQCKSLAKAGYKITLIGPADFNFKVIENISVIGIPKVKNRFGRPIIWWRLYLQICFLRPDIIHFHDPELLLLALLIRLQFKRKIKIIYDIHEYFIDSLVDKHWIPKPLRQYVGQFAKFLERLFVPKIDGIICAVEEQKPLYDFFQGPVCVIRNLPLAKLFENANPHPALDIEGFKMIYVGIIVPERGLHVIVEAMNLLQLQDQKDIHLFLIGPESNLAYINQIKSLTHFYQLSDKVHWLGYVPHDQLKHYLINADVGLNPGLSTQQFDNPAIGTKLFEYMLSGLPIISVDQPHHRIYIDESQCGLLVTIEDASSHAEAILWLKNHAKQACEMGKRSREMVLERYRWEDEESRLISFYQCLLSTGSKSE